MKTWRDLVKQLHPDANGGDHSRVQEFTKLMKEKKQLCQCGCGRKRPKGRSKFYSQMCLLHSHYSRALALLMALVLPLLAMAAPVIPPSNLRTNVILRWDYPTNELSTNLTFLIHASTNVSLPVTNWPVLATVVGTNTTVTIPLQAQQMFFVARATNYWGSSSFSGVAEAPPPPRDQNGLRLE